MDDESQKWLAERCGQDEELQLAVESFLAGVSQPDFPVLDVLDPRQRDLTSRFLREVESLRSASAGLLMGESSANASCCAGGAGIGLASNNSEEAGCSSFPVQSMPDLKVEMPAEGRDGRASRPFGKLSKRSRLAAFTTRRRNRDVVAFEQQVKELRKEMASTSKDYTWLIPESTQLVAGSEGESRMDLSDDLLHKVFSCLDDTSLCKAAMVCRQWRTASSHEDFWRVLSFKGRNVSHEQVQNICRRYPKAVELNLQCSGCLEEALVRDALRSLRNLEVLSMGTGVYGTGFFNALIHECPVLRELNVEDAVLGNAGGAQEIQIRHDSIRKLHIVKCRVIRVSVRCQQLRDLSLTRTGTSSAAISCPQLETLDLSCCHKLSDAGLRAAVTTCRLLLRLNISQCSYVGDDTLREIANCCSNLQALDATYCPNISLEGVRLPMLVSLKLRHCEGINSSSMNALSHCFMLEELHLDYCILLTNVVLDIPRLRSINLSHCRKFAELTLRTPSLVSIDVSRCPSLNKIDIASGNLQELVLKQQQGLSSLTLRCPWLRKVDLTDCDALTNCVCEVFNDGGGCPRLSCLTLDNCEGLTAIKLASNCLVSLSLVGCRKICSLELSCPNLQRLLLDGCDHLASASLSPVGLRFLNLGICPHLETLTVDAAQMTSLDLRGCGSLHRAEIVCPSLLSLDASYCSKLADECLAATTTSCPQIKSMVLAACPSVGSEGLLSLRNLTDLTYLDLSYTFLTDLCPIYEACPGLQVLKLSACKYLGNDSLVALHGGKFLPDLLELDLSYGSLGRAAIEALLAECPHLRHISLNGCSNVYDLDWPDVKSTLLAGCEVDTSGDTLMTDNAWSEQSMQAERGRAIQSLSCVGCANIKRVIFPVAAGCEQLSSLNLSLSTRLRQVRLGCANLTNLNLSHCVVLEELKLQCPRLVSLCLQASGIEEGELEQALEGCGALETLDVRNCLKISSSALSRIRFTYSWIKRLYCTLLT